MTPVRIPLFGDIGIGITFDGVKQRLMMLEPGQPVVVELSSEGGAVREAVEIANFLRAWSGGVDVEIVGWALSSATLVAMAGRRIRAHETALLMVHTPWVPSASGNADALRETAAALDQVKESMRVAYRRTRQPDSVISGWLDGRDHWFTAEQAADVGLVDEVITSSGAVASMPPVDIRACRFTVPPQLTQRIIAMTTTPNPNTGAADAAHAAGVQAEARRQADIRGLFAKYGHVNGAAALGELCLSDPSVTLEGAKARLLEKMADGVEPIAGHYVASMPRAGNTDRVRDFVAAATDTLLIRAGMQLKEAHPAVRDLRSMSVVTMAENILSMTGVSMGDRSRAAIITAALSTSDFPALLANVGGKALRMGYESAPATFVGWTAEREVADFKPQSLVSLSEAPGLLPVGEGAEYKRGKFDDSASVFKVETFGRLIEITRQAMINDDLGALTAMPRAFGLAARRLEADLVYGRLTANPVLSSGQRLFSAAHGNLGTAGALSVQTLGAARAAMRKQKGLQGLGFVDPAPEYLIVPATLETVAEQLLSSLVDPSRNNATPTVGWIRGLTLVAEPRLDASSETVWYLASAPSNVEGIVRGYIAGEPRPYFEEKAEFNRDTLGFKTRLDVCAGVVDHRALYRVGTPAGE